MGGRGFCVSDEGTAESWPVRCWFCFLAANLTAIAAAAAAGCGGGAIWIPRHNEAYPRAMHCVACADEARIAANGVHVMGHHDGLVAVVGFAAQIWAGERCEVVDPYGRDFFVLDCENWLVVVVLLTTLFFMLLLRSKVVSMKILAVKVRCLHNGANVSVVRVRGFVAGPLGAEAGRDGGVWRGGVLGWVRVEGGEEGEILCGEGGEHGGEFGEEGGGGLGGWVAKDGTFVGVEAGEDGDAEEFAGAEAGDG